MDLYEKIEKIRRKPEHIRMRYVWALVAISMLFVVVIWIFSLKSEQMKESLLPGQITDSGIADQLKEGGQNLDQIKNGINGAFNQAQSLNNNQ